MAGYTKKFLIDAFVSRFEPLGDVEVKKIRVAASTFFDEVGRDQFRVSCSLDAAKIKEFKAK